MSNHASLNLADVRARVMEYADGLLEREGRYGSYRGSKGLRPDLYASLDMVLIRVIMGEDLRETLTDQQREEWIAHINSFAIGAWRRQGNGVYTDTYDHHVLHANGMVIGALGPLGGKQLYYCTLYDEFNTPETVVPWMETHIDWSRTWGASHLFWGGMHCFSMSKHCTDAWRDTVFEWLDANLDESTGMWRKGVEPIDRHQPLGGAVHIVPIYEHHGRTFPLPEAMIDRVLDTQYDNGRWLREDMHVTMSYLELDALYALAFAKKRAPEHRADELTAAVHKYGDLVLEYWNAGADNLFDGHPHNILALVGTFGLLQQHLPERFHDTATWTDIFSDIRFYQTDKVESDVSKLD